MMGYLRPVPYMGISTYRTHTRRVPPSQEAGVDYYCPIGTPVVAPADGQVYAVGGGVTPATGRFVTIDLNDGRRVRMLHLKEWRVRAKQFVRAGDVIGLSGASGYGSEFFGAPSLAQIPSNTGGPHVHITLWPTHAYKFGTNAGTLDFDSYATGTPAGGGSTSPGGFLMALDDKKQQEIYDVISDIGVALGSAGARDIPIAERTQRSVLANLIAVAGGVANLQTTVANMNAWISEGGPGVTKGTAKPGTIAARVTNLDRQLTGADGQRVNLVQHVLDIKKIVEAGGVTEGQANAIAEAVAKQLGIDPAVIAKAVNDDAARRMTS